MISIKLQKNLEMTQPLEAFVYRSPSAQIDSLLGPSIAGGHLVSWSGARSSGKSALLRKLAEEMRIAAINVAWIDHQHTLSAADWSIPRAGKFWTLRPPTPADALFCAELLMRTNCFGLVVLEHGRNVPHQRMQRLKRIARQCRTTLVILSDVINTSLPHAHSKISFQSQVKPPNNELEQRGPFQWQTLGTRQQTSHPDTVVSIQISEACKDRLSTRVLMPDRTQSHKGTLYRQSAQDELEVLAEGELLQFTPTETEVTVPRTSRGSL